MNIPEHTKSFRNPEILRFEESLFQKYPKVFRALWEIESFWVPIAERGIEVDRGWWHIVESAAAQLEQLTSDVYFSQVKEKFGELRLYINNSADISEETMSQINTILKEANEKAIQTCEQCGDEGRLWKAKTYFHTACQTHKREGALPVVWESDEIIKTDSMNSVSETDYKGYKISIFNFNPRNTVVDSAGPLFIFKLQQNGSDKTEIGPLAYFNEEATLVGAKQYVDFCIDDGA